MNFRVTLISVIFAVLSMGGVAQVTPTHPSGEKGTLLFINESELGLTGEQQQELRAIFRRGGRFEEMEAILTPEQRATFQSIYTKNMKLRAQREALVQQELGLSPEQIEEMETLRANGGSQAEVQAIMTDEQRAKFQQLLNNSRGRPLR